MTDEERQRNTTGCSYVFTYDADMDEHFISSIPGIFPGNYSNYNNAVVVQKIITIIITIDIYHCHCQVQSYQLPVLSADMNFVKGLCDGVRLGVHAMAGFPSLHTIPHVAALKLHGITVFQQESR